MTIRLSPVLARGLPDLLIVWCPGCENIHAVSDKPGGWVWNGDVTHPTFSPSILVRGELRCHSYVRDGQWEFLQDCDHALAGQTTPLPPLPEWVTQ